MLYQMEISLLSNVVVVVPVVGNIYTLSGKKIKIENAS
jgi:hypothetical protein